MQTRLHLKNDGSKHVSESNLNADQVAFKKEKGYNDVEESKPLSQRGDRDAGKSLLDGILSFVGIRQKSDKLDELKRKDKREKNNIDQSSSDLKRAQFSKKIEIQQLHLLIKIS